MGRVTTAAAALALAAALCGAAQAADKPEKGADGKGGVFVGPDWIKRPNANDLMVVFPVKAMDQHVGGRAVLECEVALDGLLRKCKVLSEKPADLGFGQAALALVPQFRMKPATLNGAPVTSYVSIPINWEAPQGHWADRRMLTNPQWLQAPSHAQMRAAYPKNAKGGGSVLLVCDLVKGGELKQCFVEKSDGDSGFRNAAVGLSHRFRADVSDIGPHEMPNLTTQVLIRFDPQDATDATGAQVLAKAKWSQLPGLADFEALYPAKAKAQGVMTGVGVVSCQVAVGGALEECRLVSENPEGLGFGEAAMKLVAGFRLNPWTDDGRPVDGARISIPVRLNYPKPAADAAPAKKP
ncbi:MAG: TonB family protein [Proteobacteria bacterium]|nr:TonB family protein [Pseudomonadota bacterium]